MGIAEHPPTFPAVPVSCLLGYAIFCYRQASFYAKNRAFETAFAYLAIADKYYDAYRKSLQRV